MKPLKCTVLSWWEKSPLRANDIATLSGDFLVTEETVHFHSFHERIFARGEDVMAVISSVGHAHISETLTINSGVLQIPDLELVGLDDDR